MSTSHKEKIIRVLQLFQTTDEKTPMNAVQISQKLEEEYGMENVHRTSIYDDVRLLQSCGYPIKQAENSHKGWYMEKHLLEDWEIKLMLDSVQQARCVSVHEANEIRNSDEPMTEYEIYSYEAYRRKYQDDIREVPRVTLMSLDQEELNRYVELLKRGKQRLATLDNESIYELMSIKRGEKVTLSATLLFSPYPQAYFPQLCITAIVIPGRTIGSLGDMGGKILG